MLVTGAAGQLGTAFRELLPYATYVDVEEIDLTDLDVLRAALEDLQPDGIVNCAAYTAVDRAEEEEDLATVINGDAVRVMAAFAAAARTNDEVAIHLFPDRLLYASPFVGAGASLPTALTEVRADGGTALFDHLYLAIKQLESRQGRRVVIVLSDGRRAEGCFCAKSSTIIADPAVAAQFDRITAFIYFIHSGFSVTVRKARLAS